MGESAMYQASPHGEMEVANACSILKNSIAEQEALQRQNSQRKTLQT